MSHEISQERALNLWSSAARKFPPFERATHLEAAPEVDGTQIGGLADAQEEVLTYACALTNQDVYAAWGTFPPSGLLLIGQHGSGKSLLAEALATRAGTPFLRLEVPRLALEMVRHASRLGEMLEAWSSVLAEMPPITAYFRELEFVRAAELGGERSDLPVGPILDTLCELIDRAVAEPHVLLAGSTSRPDTLRPAFALPGRFERVVEVVPSYPDDIVAALRLHAAAAEKRAGRALFGPVDWADVVTRFREPSIGEWVGLVHTALRRKAREECSAGEVGPVETPDLLAEVEVLRRTLRRLRAAAGGTYL
ncbi:MAG: ATP-binding protein [Myxococcota bacterium]